MKTADIGEAGSFLTSLGYRDLIFRQFMQVHEKIFERVPSAKLEEILQTASASAKSPRPKFGGVVPSRSAGAVTSGSSNPDMALSIHKVSGPTLYVSIPPSDSPAAVRSPSSPQVAEQQPPAVVVEQIEVPTALASHAQDSTHRKSHPNGADAPAPAPIAGTQVAAAATVPAASRSDLDAEFARKAQEIKELDATISARQKELAAVDSDLAKLKQTLEQLRLEKSSMIASKAQMQEQIDASRETLKDVSSSLEQKMEQLTEISETLLDKQDRLDDMTRLVRQKETELRQKKDEIASLPSNPSLAAPHSSNGILGIQKANTADNGFASPPAESTAIPVQGAFTNSGRGGAVVDAQEDTAASSSVANGPREGDRTTFSESAEPTTANKNVQIAKLTALPLKKEEQIQLHGDLSASEDADELTARKLDAQRKRQSEVAKMSEDILASPNMREALNRSVSNPSSTSELSPRNGDEEAVSPREKRKKTGTKKNARDKDRHRERDKDKDKDKERDRERDKDRDKDKDKDKEREKRKTRTPKPSAENMFPTPPPSSTEEEPPSTAPRKIKTPKSSREKMPPVIHSNSDSGGSANKPNSNYATIVPNSVSSTASTTDETPSAVPRTKSRTPKSSREKMPTVDSKSKKHSKTPPTSEFTPFGPHTQPGSSSSSDPGYIKTPTLPPPPAMEHLEISVFTDGANRTMALFQTLTALANHLDRLFLNILDNVVKILSHIVKNISDLEFPEKERDEITDVLTINLVPPVDEGRKALQEFPALFSTSLQLKAQMYGRIAEIHVSARKIVELIEKRVKVFSIREDKDELGTDPLVREKLAPLYARDPAILKWQDFRDYFEMLFSEAHFKILRYLLDPYHIGWILFKRLSLYLSQFGPLKSSVHAVKVFLDNPAFQGLLTEAEIIAILSSCAHGTYLISLNRIQPKVIFQISWYAPQDDKIHTGRVRVDGGQYSLELNPSSQMLFNATPPTRLAMESTCGSLKDLLESMPSMLVTPFSSRFTQKSWFFGDMNAEEATRLLSTKAEGTFLFRLSSRKGYMAVSYWWQGKMGHTLIKFTNKDQYETMNEHHNGLEKIQQRYEIFIHALDCRSFAVSSDPKGQALW